MPDPAIHRVRKHCGTVSLTFYVMEYWIWEKDLKFSKKNILNL